MLNVAMSVLINSSSAAPKIHLTNEELKNAILNTSSLHSNRAKHFTKRQVITDPQPFLPLITNKELTVPIPTNIGFFSGTSSVPGKCPRDEALMDNGSCQRILTAGNCGIENEVLVDPETFKGYCAPRLCPPDRVFVPLTQLCHDPRDTTVCPPGRELVYSAHGSAVCSCPDGTIEGDDDLDDDVCELVLGKSLLCPPGQIFWFRNFESPPECLRDPCNGKNLNRNPKSLPFIPSRTGECFQLGQSDGVCQSGSFYSINLQDLKGECSNLEKAGFNIYSIEDLKLLQRSLGPIVLKKGTSPTLPSFTANTIRSIPSFSAMGNRSFSNKQKFENPPDQINGGLSQHTISNGIQHSQSISLDSSPPHQTPSHISPHSQQNKQVTTSISNNKETQLVSSSHIDSFNNGFSDSFHVQENTRFDSITKSSHIQRQPNHHLNSDRDQQQTATAEPFSVITENQLASKIPSNNFPNQVNRQKPPDEICTFVLSPGNYLVNGKLNGQKLCATVGSSSHHPNSQSSGNFGQHGIGNSREITGQVTNNSPEIFGGAVAPHIQTSTQALNSFGYRFIRSLGFKYPPLPGKLTHHVSVLPSGLTIDYLRSTNSKISKSSLSYQSNNQNTKLVRPLRSRRNLSRRKRFALPFASPSNVFETRLLGCRPGAARDINAKCKLIILPAELPKQRGIRAAPPVPPTKKCPQGMAFNIRRMCTPSKNAQNSFLAFNLG